MAYPKNTLQQFITKSESIFGNKYDYAKVLYVNNRTPVIIICPTHGEFKQRPDVHTRGSVGCKRCVNTNSVNDFKDKATVVHNGKYDYSNVKLTNTKCTVEIICPEHGIFSQVVSNHLSGRGCLKCATNTKASKSRIPMKVLLERFTSVHNGRYKYLPFDYVNRNSLVNYICPVHGSVAQTASSHLAGRGCRLCHKGGYNPELTGFLYVIKRDGCQEIKIGICNDVKKRMKSLEEDTPWGFELLTAYMFEDGRFCAQVEKAYHKVMNNCGYRGFGGATEWFHIDHKSLEMIDMLSLIGGVKIPTPSPY